jgi:hypothetical protein
MQEKKTNVKAIVSLILGCLSIVCCCVWYVGMLFGLVAIVLGILAQRDNFVPKSDLAIAGIVVGAVGFALGFATAMCYILIYTGITDGAISAAQNISVYM